MASSVAPLFETRNRAVTRLRFCSLFKWFGRRTYAVLPAGDKATACTLLHLRKNFVTDLLNT